MKIIFGMINTSVFDNTNPKCLCAKNRYIFLSVREKNKYVSYTLSVREDIEGQIRNILDLYQQNIKEEAVQLILAFNEANF